MRAAFVDDFALLAGVALHDKKTGDEPFLASLPLIERAAARWIGRDALKDLTKAS